MAPAPVIKSRLKAILRATSGNLLEQFDFFLFGFDDPAISKAFFPTGNEVTELMLTFATFWLGALMRPVRAVVLGAYSIMSDGEGTDRHFGDYGVRHTSDRGDTGICQHRNSCPNYRADRTSGAGLFGRRRLVVAPVYLFEISTPGNRGFYTSFQSASQQVAIFVAAIIGYSLSATLSPAAITDWGWRIPFFIGCLIIPFIFVLQRSLRETPEFLAQNKWRNPERGLPRHAGELAHRHPWDDAYGHDDGDFLFYHGLHADLW